MKKSQTQQILDALLKGEILTPMDILQRFGSMRASARIQDIQDLGHNVVNLEKSGRFARYKLLPAQAPVMPPAFEPRAPQPQTLFQ